jgi:RimJ/RimL family protein N-acetyltransferase
MLSLRTFPIETRRLGLRPWGPDEYPILRAILSDLETMRHWPAPLTEDTLRGWHARAMSLWKERHLGRMAVVLKETDAVIGDAGLNPMEIAGRAVTDLGYTSTPITTAGDSGANSPTRYWNMRRRAGCPTSSATWPRTTPPLGAWRKRSEWCRRDAS